MQWAKPYIVVRITPDGSTSKVHETEKIKDARYWLTYIALPGDAIFQTPAHPKHEGGDKILYKAHLIARGNVSYDENAWHKMVNTNGKAIELTV
jgi:hypothetical protein